MARIIEIHLDVRPNNSWSEMGHFKLWSNGEVLNLSRNGTLTLSDGKTITATITASSEYGGYPANYAVWGGEADTTVCSNCWCAAGVGNAWWKISFSRPITVDKITFCCGQSHSSYPGYFTATIVTTAGQVKKSEEIYCDAHNGEIVFGGGSSIYILKKNNKWYYKKGQIGATETTTVEKITVSGNLPAYSDPNKTVLYSFTNDKGSLLKYALTSLTATSNTYYNDARIDVYVNDTPIVEGIELKTDVVENILDKINFPIKLSNNDTLTFYAYWIGSHSSVTFNLNGSGYIFY